MSDVHDKKTRSYNMSRIKGKNTKPELLVRSYLHQQGFRFRIHVTDLPGKPDIVLPKYNTVVLIHGCFWHGHKGCKDFVIPKTRTKWWMEKFDRNRENDKRNRRDLKKLGWKVIEVWECGLKRRTEKTLGKIVGLIG